MIKYFKRKRAISTDLTFEEQNPIDYLYRNLKVIRWLEKEDKVKEGKRIIGVKND